jgi:hypothetical protein
MPGVWPRRKIPDFLGPALHPARPNDDVFPSAWPFWLSFAPATASIHGGRDPLPSSFLEDSWKTLAPPPRGRDPLPSSFLEDSWKTLAPPPRRPAAFLSFFARIFSARISISVQSTVSVSTTIG